MSDSASQHASVVLHRIRGLEHAHVAWQALAYAVENSNIDERSGEVTMSLGEIIALCDLPPSHASDIGSEVERVARQLVSVQAIQRRPGDRTWFVQHHAALRSAFVEHRRNGSDLVAPRYARPGRAPRVGR